MQKYYVAETDYSQEVVAEEYLNRAGFQVYNPKIVQKVCSNNPRFLTRRVGVVSRPLFPGYLFVLLDTEEPLWKRIFGVRRVRGLLGEPEKPIAIPDRWVEEFQRRVLAGEFDKTNQEKICADDMVRIISGSMEGLIARCVSTNSKNVIIEVTRGGRARDVVVPRLIAELV